MGNKQFTDQELEELLQKVQGTLLNCASAWICELYLALSAHAATEEGVDLANQIRTYLKKKIDES